MRRRETDGTFARLALPITEIVSLYRSGISELALAKKFGVSRGAIRERLIETGTEIRGQSDAEVCRWNQMSEEQRLHQIEAAHNAARGRKASREERIKGASSRQQNPILSPLEQQFFDVFKRCEIEVIPQYAMEIYNVDFAVPKDKVAIEIDGGNWHDSDPKRGYDRGKEVLLASHGWKLVRVKVAKDYITVSTNVDKTCLGPILQAIYSNPAIWSQDRMIPSYSAPFDSK
jgi:very-short-patch-repair endonuclease